MNDTATDLANLSPGQQIQITEPRDTAVMPGFNSQNSWELANRIGKAFAASSLVPAQYQGNVANCIVALEMANRMGASPLMVMQNLYIVHGNPGWSSKFLVACFNQSGRFSALRYEWTPDRTGCRAWAIEKATGERIDGPQVTMQMAKDEGWSTKSGSKWKTMPELMLMYRAAAFLIRTYAPEISMGLQTNEEIIDTVEEVRSVTRLEAVRSALTPPVLSEPALEVDSFVAAMNAAEQRSAESA
ncbi:MAG: recombinase RecT [Rhizobacter sp.]